MFFSPTLLSLSAHNHLRILCLSSGDADGLGSIRKHELVSSCRALGVHGDGDVTVIEDVLLPDSMSAVWPAKTVTAYLREHAATSDVVVTFDAGGVSGHPNHISLLHGAREFVKERGGGRLFTLTSVGLVRKYISVLDAVVTLAGRRGEGEMVFVSTARQVRIAQRAMTEAHKSQMRWFRWGWIGLSRYMVVNDLREEKVGA